MPRGHSTLTTLVAMLAVGGLAFGGHWYMTTDPADRAAQLASFTSKLPVVTAGGHIPSISPEASSAELLAAMRKAEEGLWSRPEDGSPPAEETAETVKWIQAHVATLGARPEATDDERSEADLIALRAEYLGARSAPDQFRDAFRSHVARVIEASPDGPVAAQAATYRIFEEHPLDIPPDPKFYGDLAQFARTYGDTGLGIPLFLSTSRELTRNGHRQAAAVVLRQGLTLFEGPNGKAQLVNELAEQGHSKAPDTSGAMKEAWKSHTRTLNILLRQKPG